MNKFAGNSFEIRSNGVPCEGIEDQYGDGKIANIYELFIGDANARTDNYKKFLVSYLKQHGCKRILDACCGTGIDSILLLEAGFEVVSTDASDKMLKYALKTRWERRNEPAFNNWIIEEANWVSICDDIEHLIGTGFDAVICFGSSFGHLLDRFGDQREHKQALRSFEKCIKPGGLLLIDHRNYEDLLDIGSTSSETTNVYYNSKHLKNIKTSVLYSGGIPSLVIRDYTMDLMDSKYKEESGSIEFRLCFYPHRLEDFKKLLRQVFGENSKYEVLGDFKPLKEISVPTYYIHIIKKTSSVI